MIKRYLYLLFKEFISITKWKFKYLKMLIILAIMKFKLENL